MPRTLIRFLAMALLALAIPVQGVASIVAGQCMTFGHHQDAGHDGPPSGHGDDGHDHAPQADSDQGAGGGHCGPCAACCASASIAGMEVRFVAPAASISPYLFTQSPPPGVQPDGVYRPPLAL
jgi:hypothetical protein